MTDVQREGSGWAAPVVHRPDAEAARRLLKKMEWPLALLALAVVPALILEDRTTNPTVSWLCKAVNWIVWLAFVGEFVIGFLAAKKNRSRFFRQSWFNLAIIVVAPPFLVPDALQSAKGLRALRILRLMRFMRGLAVAAIGLRTARKVLRSHGFPYVLVVAAATIALGAAGIWLVEKETVKSPGDALWWAIVTVTAVGYGDVAPVTGEGRLIALVLMCVGVGVIGVFTATVASFFVDKDNDGETRAVEARLGALEGSVAEVLKELRQINEARAVRSQSPNQGNAPL